MCPVRPDPSCTLEQVLLTANDILQGALHKDLGDIKETPLGQGITSLLNKLGPIQVGDDTFAAYLMRELWAIAGSGDHLPVGVAANSLMWSSFHKFRVGQKVQDMWNTFLKVKGMKDAEKSTSDMLLQQVLQNSLSSVISMRSVTSTAEAECSYELTNHDEQVLKYVAGFVPFALCKRFRRYQSDNAAQFVHFLQSLHAEGDDETTAESFMSYRCVWTTLQNRGGLFIVNDSAYKFFRTMEVETRKHLSSDFLLKGRDEALTAKLTESISCSVHVQRLWDNMQGDELTNGQVLLKTIINYWVAIRLRAFVKVFLEEKRAAQNKQRREKGLRKELRRKSKQTEWILWHTYM